MKRLFLSMILASACFWGCGPSESEKKAAAETARLDSLSSVIEQTRRDIESTREELMDMVNKL